MSEHALRARLPRLSLLSQVFRAVHGHHACLGLNPRRPRLSVVYRLSPVARLAPLSSLFPVARLWPVCPLPGPVLLQQEVRQAPAQLPSAFRVRRGHGRSFLWLRAWLLPVTSSSTSPSRCARSLLPHRKSPKRKGTRHAPGQC